MKALSALALVLLTTVGCHARPAVKLAPAAVKATATAEPLIYNPTIIQFDSADHAIVSVYKVETWLLAADPLTGQPITVMTLAKDKALPGWCPIQPCVPEFQANIADGTPLFSVPVGQTYVFRMKAVGLGAEALESPRSDPSGPFAIAGVPRSVVGLSIK
jgi:hypothetical protein